MRKAAADGFSTATDLADYLVSRNIPFRDAHEIVGRIVRHCLDNHLSLESLSLKDLQSFHSSIDENALTALNPESSVAARNHAGGTAPKQVLLAVKEGRQRIGKS